MYLAKYLLSIEEFMEQEKGEALLERVFLCVDDARREKALRVRQPRARAACLGAGLLLQLAGREALRGAGAVQQASASIERYAATELLARVEGEPRLAFRFRYGEKGKPYFQDLPFHFSLSHSGDSVLCALSAAEIGADLQSHCAGDVGRLARRFFSEREIAALEEAGEGRERLFYRLWARKEAYGKLTGEGIAGALGVDLLQEGNGLAWETCEEPEGCSIAICSWAASALR